MKVLRINMFFLLGLFGSAALAFCVWIIGPLVAIGAVQPLESEASRSVFIGVALLLSWALPLARTWRRWRVSGGELTPDDPIYGPQLAAVWRDLLSRRPVTAKDSPDSQRGWRVTGAGGRRPFALPWIVVVGQPAAGKTTLLRHSGAHRLRDPALAPDSPAAQAPCQWWRVEGVMVLEVPSTPDRANESPHDGGVLFRLLRHLRPQRPLDALVVTVSARELVAGTSEDLERAATSVRRFAAAAGSGVPIHIVVTQCDLLAGFVALFARGEPDRLQEPWGFRLSRGDGADPPAELACLQARIDSLSDRLKKASWIPMLNETDPTRRMLIGALVLQFEVLCGILKHHLARLNEVDTGGHSCRVRGVYFTGVAQNDRSLDLEITDLTSRFGLRRLSDTPSRAVGVAHFVRRLFPDIVAGVDAPAAEAGRAEGRQRALAYGAYVVPVLCASLLIAVLVASYVANLRHVDRVALAVDDVARVVQAAPDGTSSDLLPLLSVLDAMRDLVRGWDDGASHGTMAFGLGQEKKLGAAAAQAYRRMLVDGLMPRLVRDLEAQLRSGSTNAERQYEALKTYVMFHDPQHFDSGAIKLHVMASWEMDLPRSVTFDQRAAMESHLEALLAEGAMVSPIPEDRALVAASRAQQLARSLGQRIYGQIMRRSAVDEFPEFTLARAGGSSAALIFDRASGESLFKGVPGAFTFDGYHVGFQREVGRVTRQLADEEVWVLGAGQGAVANFARLDGIQRTEAEVRRLYLTEYARVWEDFIADIRLQKTSNLAQVLKISREMAAPDDPLARLVKAMSRETTLMNVKELIAIQERQARDAVQRSRDELLRVLGGKGGASSSEAGLSVERIVDDRFQGMRALVSPPASGSRVPWDAVMEDIEELNKWLFFVDYAARTGERIPASQIPMKLKANASRLPAPLNQVLFGLAEGAQAALLQAGRKD